MEHNTTKSQKRDKSRVLYYTKDLGEILEHLKGIMRAPSINQVIIEAIYDKYEKATKSRND